MLGEKPTDGAPDDPEAFQFCNTLQQWEDSGDRDVSLLELRVRDGVPVVFYQVTDDDDEIGAIQETCRLLGACTGALADVSFAVERVRLIVVPKSAEKTLLMTYEFRSEWAEELHSGDIELEDAWDEYIQRTIEFVDKSSGEAVDTEISGGSGGGAR